MNNKFVITKITQPTDNTCVSACLAMILNRDINEIINEFHYKYQENSLVNNEFDYLDSHGVGYELLTAREQGVYKGELYYAYAPSLNIIGGSHAIIIDARFSATVYDSNQIGKKIYTLDSNMVDDNTILLTSWTLACRFNIDTLRNRF